MSTDPDPKAWSFEAFINHPDGGREYHRHGRDNGDGTVTVYVLDLPKGYVERVYPKAQVELRDRPEDKAKRWYDLFKRVYGPGPD